jgi:putative ABC transport system ATP-binding protein
MGNILVSLQNVHKTFQKGQTTVHAVAGVTLDIRSGDFIAIMGPSGCGKSTLLHLIGGLESPTSGVLLFNGTDLTHMSDHRLSQFRNRHVGFVFQAFNLLPELTVIDNVALPLKYAGIAKTERRRRAYAMLERVGLADRASHYPAELSGGQEQRTAIARALVMEPALVMADEPTGNLDSATRDQILALFNELNAQGTTLLVVTHDPIVASAAQRVLQMRDGALETEPYQLSI